MMTTPARLCMCRFYSLVNGDFAAPSGFVFTEQEGQGNHNSRRATKDEEHVLIGESVRLLLELVVDLPLRQIIGIRRACAAGKDVAESVDLILHVRTARRE